MKHLINDVEVLYPRINQTYRFDNTENRSVPCDPLDDGASYEMSFRMNTDQAKALYKAMSGAYKERREDKWPEKLEMPFKKDDEGMFIGKAKLKGAYGKDVTQKPRQFDAQNNKLPEDFRLTTGSTANVAVVFVPYNMRDHGVSLRLNAVQVIKYAEPKESGSPFGAVDGFTSDDASPFAGEGVSQEKIKEATADVFDEEPAPKKVVKKKAAPKPKDKQELSSIVDDWDDE
tara:strand:- start:530 stop:1222 length:693 start_codon:yes stop_codon:yes gene_type:complete